MFAVERQMQKVWEDSDVAPRNLLRKLLLGHERLQSLPVDVVLQVLYYERRGAVPHQGTSYRRGGERKRTKRETAVDRSMGKEAQAGKPI